MVLRCAGTQNRFESGPTTVVHSSKLLKYDVKPDHSLTLKLCKKVLNFNQHSYSGFSFFNIICLHLVSCISSRRARTLINIQNTVSLLMYEANTAFEVIPIYAVVHII